MESQRDSLVVVAPAKGVSGAIKRRAGLGPFRELGRLGPIPLGGAMATSSGRLPFRTIIHVAGINLLWRASKQSIADSTRNAIKVASEMGLRSVAFPIIGAGSGGFDPVEAERIMVEAMADVESSVKVVIVRFRKRSPTKAMS